MYRRTSFSSKYGFLFFSKRNFRVLASKRAKEAKTVDSTKQISAIEYQEMKKKQDRQISRSDIRETSKSGEMRRHPTIRILLNKWQRQKEKEQMRREKEHWRYQEECERRRVQEKTNIIGTVLSSNIAGMKA